MKPKSNRRGSKVTVVRKGSVAVQIREGMNRVGGEEYAQFVLTYHSGGQRVRKRFSDWATAKSEAVLVADRLSLGEHQALELKASDRSDYLEAIKDLQPLGLPLHVATAEFVMARSLLPDGATLVQAAEFFAKHKSQGRTQKKVSDVVLEFLESRRKAGRSSVHVRDLHSRLTKFAEAFEKPIDAVSIPEVERFLDRLKVGGRTRLNYLRHISSLFRFAARRKFLPRETLDDLLSIEKPQVEDGAILIFTPAELREMLAALRPELVGWLAVAAFTGLRSAELQRLDWSEVQLDRGFIVVPAAKAKTASRRLVPISANLRAWLEPIALASGPVTTFANMAKQIIWLTDAINEARTQKSTEAPRFAWKRNALRHSFVSYRMAQIQDVAKVSLEAGNSAGMVFRNYRELVTQDQAAEWFNILPESTVVTAPQTVPVP